MKTFDCDQYSPSWWEVRRGIPTASCASDIITPAKGDLSKSADKYICQLLADRYDPAYGQVDDYVSAAMKNGTLMEPEARRFYEFDMDVEVRQVGFCLTDDGRAGCSPDGLVGDDGGCEIKSPTHKVHVGYLLDGGMPVEYRPQVHWSLVVTGRKWWDFWSYAPGLPPLRVRVEPDDYTDKVREAMTTFCDRLAEQAARLEAMVGEWSKPDAATLGRKLRSLASGPVLADLLARHGAARLEDLTADQLAAEIDEIETAVF